MKRESIYDDSYYSTDDYVDRFIHKSGFMSWRDSTYISKNIDKFKAEEEKLKRSGYHQEYFKGYVKWTKT